MNNLFHWSPRGIEHYGYHSTLLNQIRLVDPYARIYTPNKSYGGIARKETSMSIAISLKGKDGMILATDSRIAAQTPLGTARTHVDGVVKLWAINNKLCIASVGNIAGYEARIVDIFKRKLLDREIKDTGFNQLVEGFAECLKEDWDKWTKGVDLRSAVSYYVEFVLAGYDQQGQQTIERIFWDYEQRIFAAKLIMRYWYATGIPFVVEYWMKKLENYLPSATDQALKKIGSFLISESAIEFDGIGGAIQMALIKKDVGLQLIGKEETETLLKHIESKTESNLIQVLTED